MIEVLVVEVALEAGLLCVASILLPIFDILPGASCASADVASSLLNRLFSLRRWDDANACLAVLVLCFTLMAA